MAIKSATRIKESVSRPGYCGFSIVAKISSFCPAFEGELTLSPGSPETVISSNTRTSCDSEGEIPALPVRDRRVFALTMIIMVFGSVKSITMRKKGKGGSFYPLSSLSNDK